MTNCNNAILISCFLLGLPWRGDSSAAPANDIQTWIPSGNAFGLRGLMDAFADTHDSRFLDAARKLARYFEAIAPRWETRQQGKVHEFCFKPRSEATGLDLPKARPQ